MQNLLNTTASLENKIETQKETINQFEQVNTLINGTVYWKDLAGAYLGCNQNYILELFYNGRIESKRTSIISKTDFDLFPTDAANNYRQNDIKVIDKKDALMIEELSFSSQSLTYFLLSNKHPLFDQQGKICGVIGNTFDFSYLTINGKKIHLTYREIQIYASLFYSMPAKAAANIFSIASKTVEGYIQTLKIKLNSSTREKLITLALENNLQKPFENIIYNANK